jgi:cell division septation protein DedD
VSEDVRERRGESGRAQRSRRGPGLASALAGAGLLVVLGFALGVVGGLVLEEPDLLLDYVLGRTEQVAVGDPGPDVAAQPPPAEALVAATPPPAPVAAQAEEPAADVEEWAEGGAAEPTAPDVSPVVERASEPVAVAAVPPAGFAVQVGAFADAATAEQVARRLRARGHPVYVAPAAGSDTARWRVRVGPLSSRAEAEGVAARLEREEGLSTWVLAESAR